MNIQKNPFYILGVSCSDNRRAIMSAAEEMGFALDQDVCNEAQNALINPSKRLSAELDWFIDLDNYKIRSIRRSIDNGEVISTDGLSPLSKLNAALFNFSISNGRDINDISHSIFEINNIYSAVDASKIVSVLNTNRTAAKMIEVQPQAVLQELNKKRESIRQIIMEKLSQIGREKYIELVTLLAEKCVNNDDNAGVVISDVIDQYEVSIQSELEKSTEEIKKYIKRIKSQSLDNVIHNNISELIRRVRAWDKLAQPLQLKSQASGMPHQISEHLGSELRSLILFLHNEKGLSKDALTLVDAMRDVFAEVGTLAALFETDSNTLSELIKSNTEADDILKEIQSLQSEAEDLKRVATETRINSFISRVNALDRKIKGLGLESQIQTKLREALCYIARDVAITLHNNKNQTEYASKIANALKTEFSDIPSLRTKLTEDCDSLDKQMLFKQIIEQHKANTEREKAEDNFGCLVKIFIGIIILCVLLSMGSCSAKSLSSNSSSYSISFSNIEKTPSPYTSNFDSSAATSIYNSFADEVSFSSPRHVNETVKTASNIKSGFSADTGTHAILSGLQKLDHQL